MESTSAMEELMNNNLKQIYIQYKTDMPMCPSEVLSTYLQYDSHSLYKAIIMIAAGDPNAAQELRQHAMSDRPQPRARRRVVEHLDPARRLPRADALRPVSEELGHRAEHAGAASKRPRRGRVARALSLQRTPAA